MIAPTYGQDMLNAFTPDGWLEPRRGFKHLSSGGAPSGFTAAYGIDYLQGYSSSNVLVEEYATVETHSGTTYPYACDKSTGARTQITGPGPTNIALHASRWRWTAFNGTGYGVNHDDTYPVVEYTIGSHASLIQIKTPDAPTDAPTFATTTPSGGAYATFPWTGVVTGSDITYSGDAQASGSSVDGGGNLIIKHSSGSTPVTCGILVNLAAHVGEQDWRFNDRFGITATLTPGSGGTGSIDWSQFVFTFIMDDTSSWQGQILGQSLTGQVVTNGSSTCNFVIGFDGKLSNGVSARSPWQKVKYIQIQWLIPSYTASTLKFSPVMLGGVILGHPPTRSTNDVVGISYTYYSSTTGLESGQSPLLSVPNTIANGLLVYPTIAYTLGALIDLSCTASSDGTVDTYKFYLNDPAFTGNQNFYLIGSQSSVSNLPWELTEGEIAVPADLYSPSAFEYSKVTGCCAFKGWMVWFMAGGYQNVRHSRINQPLSLEQATDQIADDSRGQTFSLADDYSDSALCGFAADDSLIILGSQGAYAQVSSAAMYADALGFQQVGLTPSTMLPPKRVPGSKACVGADAAALFYDTEGAPGVAWMDPDGEIWFVRVSGSFDGSVGYALDHLSEGIFGKAKSFLMTGQSLSSLSGVQMAVDEFASALWVFVGNRALVYRKPSLIDGKRQWEPYQFNFTGSVTLNSLAFSPQRRCRALLSDGRIVEFEYDSTANNVPITGTTRDDGSSMPVGYWQSKTFVSPGYNMAPMAAIIERDVLTDQPTLTAYSSDQPGGVAVQIASGQSRLRFPCTATGRNLSYKIDIKESYSPFHRIIIDETDLGLSGPN